MKTLPFRMLPPKDDDVLWFNEQPNRLLRVRQATPQEKHKLGAGGVPVLAMIVRLVEGGYARCIFTGSNPLDYGTDLTASKLLLLPDLTYINKRIAWL